MRIRDIMTKDPITVEPKTSLPDAHRIMRQQNIRKLPVLEGEKLVGIVTYDMVLEASPSPATSLSIQELHYLLAEMKVEEIMDKNPVTLAPETPFEKALAMGQSDRIRGFPVVDKDKLVGIATHGDIIQLLTKTLGLQDEGIRITIEGLGGRLGELKDIISIFDRHQAAVMSIMTLPKKEKKDWLVAIRLNARDGSAIVDDLRKAGLQVKYSDESGVS
ncbi:MAG: CBS domain-containing protein [Deltaproteobacteria bacterium]|nr:CBS domain-containing protein [Deltaproteobacteria bacterium]